MTLSRKYRSSRKAPSATRCLKVAAGGGDDAHLGLASDIFAHPLVFTFLKQPQQLGLDFHRQVADLVEEEGPARGGFDFAPMVAQGAGERAFDVAEQVAFQQFLGQTRTAHGDERSIRQMALLVNGAGHHALAGAAFAQDQNRGRCFRRSQQGVHHLFHERRA